MCKSLCIDIKDIKKKNIQVLKLGEVENMLDYLCFEGV